MKKFIFPAFILVLIFAFGYGCQAKHIESIQKNQKSVEQFEYTGEIALQLKIRELFENRQFQELNSLLEGCQQDFEKDFHNEYKVLDAFNAFFVTITSYEKLFDEWIEAFPNKYPPYLARANYFFALGWESRDTKLVKDTTEEQFERMKSYFAKATENVNTALQLNPKLVFGYQILIGIKMTFGDRETNKQLVREMLEICPYCFIVRSVYMNSLEPRWGGSYEAMEQFAKEAQKYADINPKLKALQGFTYYDQGRMAESDERNDKAIELYTKAISFGDCWSFYNDRARVYYRLQQYDKALADVNQVILLRPTIEDAYLLRSMIYYVQKNVKAALKDVQTAEILSPGNPEVKKCRNWDARDLLRRGNSLLKSNLSQAIEKYSLGIQFDPEFAEIYYWRGVAYSRIKKSESALSDFKKSIELDPHHFDSYRMLDYILAKKRDWNVIIDYWNKFIELEPEHAEAYLERGGTYYQKGNMDAALKDIKKSCDLGNQEGCKRYQQLKQKLGK